MSLRVVSCWKMVSLALYLQVSPWRMRSAGLMTAGMVFAYATFLLWSALSSEPDDYGCIFHRNKGQQQVMKVIIYCFPEAGSRLSKSDALFCVGRPICCNLITQLVIFDYQNHSDLT